MTEICKRIKFTDKNGQKYDGDQQETTYLPAIPYTRDARNR